MRGWGIALAVVLAAFAGYAFALWVHDVPEAPENESESAYESAPTSAPAPEPVPQPEPEPAPKPEPAPAPYRPEPRVRELFTWLTDTWSRFSEGMLLVNGWRRFEHTLPEEIAYRDHDFLHEVTRAYAKRWYAPKERAAYHQALRAWRRTLQHRQRLLQDATYRAAESMLANLAHERAFKDLHLLAHSAPPFLLLYASREPLSPWHLPRAKHTDLALAEIEKRRARGLQVLKRNAVVSQAVRAEIRRRYADSLALPELSAPYGGRDDLPHGVRSYTDGVVLVSITFDARKTAERYSGSWRYWQGLHSGTGFVLGLALTEADETSPFWSTWYGREVAYQLLWWYTRQRNRWGRPRPENGFAEVGVAALLGAVQLDPKGRARWTGMSGRRLQDMQIVATQARERGKDYPLYPVRKLVGLGSVGAIQSWAVNEWELQPGLTLSLYRQQAWALAHFLDRSHGKALERYLALVIARQTGAGKDNERAFAEAFRLRDDDDWRELDAAFQKHIRETLMKTDWLRFLPKPPGLEVWGR